ncbi:MAG: diguanylate cyclase [Deltaproteobacteria bacterium]
MTKVYIKNGFMQDRSFAFQKTNLLIGRSPASDIQINDSYVSRKHARILKSKDRFFIEDLGSKNGTWINGSAIDRGRKVEIQEGVPIRIGGSVIHLDNGTAGSLPDKHLAVVPGQADESGKSPALKDRRIRSRENVELIYNVCLNLMQSLEVKEICENVLDSLFYCMKRIDSAHILLVEEGNPEPVQTAVRWRKAAGGDKPGYSRRIVDRVLLGAEPIMMPDTRLEDGDRLSDSIESMGVKSLMCVPLISKVGVRGVIYVQSVHVTHAFRKDDLFLLTGLSTPAALAIENALLHSQRKQAEEALKKARDNLEMEVKQRTAELTKANSRLEELSVTDGLTGLYNYRYLMHSLDTECKRAVRYRHNVSLLMIDIDYFKVLNDTYGHQCGDYVIREIAKILKRNVRGTDVVARYGGDELAVVLVETNEASSLEVAEKLKDKIAGAAFTWRGKSVDVEISIGLATAPSPGIENSEELLNAADRALYQAKKAGKNSVIAFQPRRKRK